MRKLWRWAFVWMVATVITSGLMGGSVLAAGKFRVAIGFNGPIRDMGWYEGGYEAAIKLKEDPGVDEVTFHERMKNSDLEGAMRRWAVEGYDLIIGHSFEFGEPALKLAAVFPKTVFAIPFFFKVEGHPNVVTYGSQSHEAVYLAGLLAALMSKSKMIGVISGFPIPNQISEQNSYKLGARSVVSNIQVRGVFVNDWFDASKAKEAALAMIEQGIDVVYANASPMGFGAIKGAEEKGVYSIGTYMDVSRVAPESVITSTVFVWHTPLKQIVLDMKAGKLKNLYLFGLREGGTTLAPFSAKVPAEVAQKVRAVEKDIKAGKLKVPFLKDKLID